MALSEPMRMTCLKNITQEISAAGAALQKPSGGDGWNSTATSLDCMESLHGSCRGLQFKVSDASGCSGGQWFYIGLTGMPGCPQDPHQEATLRESCQPSSISFAARIADGGKFYVEESNSTMGQFGTGKPGDVVEIRLTAEDVPKIEYLKNKQLMYTSTKKTPSQLCAKVCAYNPTPLVEELQWIFDEPRCDVEREGEVALTDIHGIVRNPFTRALSKMQYLLGNATVRSKDAIADIGCERVGTSFVISESEPGTDQKFAIGLASNPDQGPSSLESLDHAIHIRGSSLKVYVKGIMQGEIQQHVKAGDRIDMIFALDEESSQPKIQYYANRQLLGDILSEVHFPLYVKVYAMSSGKLIEDLRWIDRSQLQAPCLRHAASPAPSIADDTAVRVSHLEMTVSKVLAEVDASKGAAEVHAQALEASRLEKAILEAKVEEMRSETGALKMEVASLKEAAAKEQAKLHEASQVNAALLEVQLQEMKAKLDELMPLTVGQAQLHAEISALKTEFGALKKKAAEEQAQLLEEARVEKEQLEARLKETKAELAEAKEALSAATKERAEVQPHSRSATLHTSDTNDLEDKPEEAEKDADGQQTQPDAKESPELQQLKPADLLAHVMEKFKQEMDIQMRRVVKEVHSVPPSAATLSTSISKDGFLEEDFLAAMLERAQLRRQNVTLHAASEQSSKVPQVRPEMQHPQEQADSEKTLALEADKAHLQMQNQRLQQRCAQLEELERRICHATQILHTSHFPQKSEADSSEWEPLGSDLPASGPAV